MSVHPRKSRVVVLLECCGTREELSRPLNAQEGPRQTSQWSNEKTYAVHTLPLQERASTNETRGYRFGRDECVTSSPAFSFSASRFVS